jgi:hypothetical protein
MAKYINWFKAQSERSKADDKILTDIPAEVLIIHEQQRKKKRAAQAKSDRYGRFKIAEVIGGGGGGEDKGTVTPLSLLDQVVRLDRVMGFCGREIPRSLVYSCVFYSQETVDDTLDKNENKKYLADRKVNVQPKSAV